MAYRPPLSEYLPHPMCIILDDGRLIELDSEVDVMTAFPRDAMDMAFAPTGEHDARGRPIYRPLKASTP